MVICGGGLNGATQHPRETAPPRLLAAESGFAGRLAFVLDRVRFQDVRQ
jgi:hypothetical protein